MAWGRPKFPQYKRYITEATRRGVVAAHIVELTATSTCNTPIKAKYTHAEPDVAEAKAFAKLKDENAIAVAMCVRAGHHKPEHDR